MVLEHIFPENWLEKKAMFAFILGIGYSLIGIIFAKLLFPQDPALVAVAFTSLLLLPELNKLIIREERVEEKEKKFKFKNLFKDNKNLTKIYVCLFIGIMITYSAGAIILPSFQSNKLFREQLEIRGFDDDTDTEETITGLAIFSNKLNFTGDLFEHILKNNFKVLIAIFLIALLTGDGAIFLITWNASVWGTIFGITAKNAGSFTGTNPWIYFGLILLIVLPHVIIESLAYIFAAISGSVISKDVILEKFESKRFKEVFIYNINLILIALIVLLIGAGIETWVLDNVHLYQDIILKSFGIII